MDVQLRLVSDLYTTKSNTDNLDWLLDLAWAFCLLPSKSGHIERFSVGLGIQILSSWWGRWIIYPHELCMIAALHDLGKGYIAINVSPSLASSYASLNAAVSRDSPRSFRPRGKNQQSSFGSWMTTIFWVDRCIKTIPAPSKKLDEHQPPSATAGEDHRDNLALNSAAWNLNWGCFPFFPKGVEKIMVSVDGMDKLEAHKCSENWSSCQTPI